MRDGLRFNHMPTDNGNAKSCGDDKAQKNAPTTEAENRPKDHTFGDTYSENTYAKGKIEAVGAELEQNANAEFEQNANAELEQNANAEFEQTYDAEFKQTDDAEFEQADDAESIKNEESEHNVGANQTDPSVTVDGDISELKKEFGELINIEKISDLQNPTRYAALRDLGLTPTEAYLATQAPRSAGKSHLTSSVPRTAKPPVGAMSKEALREAREIFYDMDDGEIQRLYKKVTTN
jgi:hypothetical protein